MEWLNQLLAKNHIFTADTLLHYWQGGVTTIQMTFLSLLVGLIIAMPLGVLRAYGNIWVSRAIWLYTYVFRGTPLLIQLYVIYYGLPFIPGIRETIWWDLFFKEPFYPALIAFSLNTAAYTTEILRGAIAATPKGEIEAARAYGMSWWKRTYRIVLPSAARRAVQAYSNEVIFMLQATSLASVVTIVDLTSAARDIYARFYAPFWAFSFVALIYLCLTFIIVYLFKRLERRLLAHQRPING